MSVHADPPPPIVPEPTRYSYQTGPQLGKGGFAICHRAELFDEGKPTGKLLALKIVRSQMEPAKLAQKFVTELQLHSKLHHPNIVHFHRAFSFEKSTYVVLEICDNGSLADALKVRKSFTMPEIRRFVIQICGAVKYLHYRNIIHRDLKTGNLFLDSNMNIKVGDFGLAAVLMTSNELGQQRRTTMCGTPNYLAPEILEKGGKGHNEKVDLWAIGIIAYTLAVGKAPFHAAKREDIYRKLKAGDYNWPALGKAPNDISNDLKDLVASLLVHEDERPTPDEIVSHPFFRMGFVPETLSTSILTRAPSWTGLNKPPTSRDIARECTQSWYSVCKTSGVGFVREGEAFEIAGGSKKIRSVIRDCEQEIKLGLGPIVPVPKDRVYLPYPEQKGWPYGESEQKNNLSDISEEKEPSEDSHKLAEISGNPQKPRRLEERARRSGGTTKENTEAKPMPPPTVTRKRSVPSREKPSAVEPKPRVVSQVQERLTRRVASARTIPTREATKDKVTIEVVERRAVEKVKTEVVQREKESTPEIKSDEIVASATETPTTALQTYPILPHSDPASVLARVSKLRDNIAQALAGRHASGRKPVHPPQLPFVAKWVDYSKKHGAGYVLEDGSVGCCFRATDRSPVVHFVVRNGTQYLKRLTDKPAEIKGVPLEYYKTYEGLGLKKYTPKELDGEKIKGQVVMWTRFAKYMLVQLAQGESETESVSNPKKAGNFVRFYQRLANVGIWGFDDGSFQFNFPDHTKIVLSPDGRYVNFTVLSTEAAQRLQTDGELPFKFVKSRSIIVNTLHALLHGSSSRDDMEMKIIARANMLREKMEFITTLLDEWLNENGLGVLGKEMQTFKYEGPSLDDGKRVDWVTVGRFGGDERRVC